MRKGTLPRLVVKITAADIARLGKDPLPEDLFRPALARALRIEDRFGLWGAFDGRKGGMLDVSDRVSFFAPRSVVTFARRVKKRQPLKPFAFTLYDVPADDIRKDVEYTFTKYHRFQHELCHFCGEKVQVQRCDCGTIKKEVAEAGRVCWSCSAFFCQRHALDRLNKNHYTPEQHAEALERLRKGTSRKEENAWSA